MRAAGFSFKNRKRSPSAMVGRARTVSRSRVYGRPANIAISTTAMTSPASAPIIEADNAVVTVRCRDHLSDLDRRGAAAPHCLFMLDSFRQARARCPEGNAAQRLRNSARLRPSIQRRRRGLSADCQAPVQNWMVCFVSAACCLRASAEATLRARPAAAFAALNHMLISGFFFNQGFAIYLFPSIGRARGLHSTSVREIQTVPRLLQRMMNGQRCRSFRGKRRLFLGPVFS